MVHRHPELLGDDADAVLSSWADVLRDAGDHEEAAVCEVHRALLRRCRAIGVERAFVEFGERNTAYDDAREERVIAMVETSSAALRQHRGDGANAHLHDAVAVLEDALAVAEGTPHRPVVLSNLGVALVNRFELLGDDVDLDRAVAVATEAVAATSPALPERTGYLANLGRALSARADLHSDSDSADVERAVEVLREAAARASADPTLDADTRGAVLTNLGAALYRRFLRVGDAADLAAMAEALTRAVDVTPASSAEHAPRLGNLGMAYSEIARRGGDPSDFDRAAGYLTAAVDAATAADDLPALPGLLTNLAAALAERHGRSGDMHDLQRAHDAIKRAVELTPPRAPDRPGRVHSLGAILRERYLRTGDLSYLDEAVAHQEEAVAALPADSSEFALCLDQLAGTLRIRGSRTRNAHDLERAVSAHERSVDLGGAADRYIRLNNLGGSLRALCALTGDETVLDRAIAVYRQAVALAPPGTDDAATARTNLGNGLLDRSVHTRDDEMLDEAVDVIHGAVALTADDSPERAGRLNSLANAYRERHNRTGGRRDLDAGVRAYRDGCAHAERADAAAELVAADNWGQWASERLAWPEVIESHAHAVAAFERLFRVQVTRGHRETWMVAAQAVQNRAAYALAATGRPADAAVAVEHGRARVLSEALEHAHFDIERLEATHPEPAARYRAASAVVDRLTRPSGADIRLADGTLR